MFALDLGNCAVIRRKEFLTKFEKQQQKEQNTDTYQEVPILSIFRSKINKEFKIN